MCVSVFAVADELVLVGGNYCPYSCDDPDAPGFANEVVEHIFEPLGYKLTHITKPWLRDVALVQQGIVGDKRYHAVMAVNPENQPGLIFPALPFMKTRYCFFTLADGDWMFEGGDSRPVRLGAVAEHSWTADIHDYLDRIKASHPVSYHYGKDVDLRLIQLLKSARVDAVIENQGVLRYHAMKLNVPVREAGCKPTQGGGLYVAFSASLPESYQLLAHYNEAYPRFAQSAAYRRLLEKYHLLGVTAYQPPSDIPLFY